VGDAAREYLECFRSLGLKGSPCSASEVERLQNASALPLPAAYKAYLLIAGQAPPSVWFGSDCAVCHLPSLRAAAERLLRESGRPPLPTEAFVFLMHQGYQFFLVSSFMHGAETPLRGVDPVRWPTRVRAGVLLMNRGIAGLPGIFFAF
jgi:hypothetical protein